MQHRAYRLYGLCLSCALCALLLAACGAPGGSGTPLPAGTLFAYSQEGGIAGFCDRLTVANDGTITYELPCAGIVMTRQVPDATLAQLKDLAARLAPVNRASEGKPGMPDNMKVAMALNGTGTAQAGDADLEALYSIGRELAATLHAQAVATRVAATRVPPAVTDVP